MICQDRPFCFANIVPLLWSEFTKKFTQKEAVAPKPCKNVPFFQVFEVIFEKFYFEKFKKGVWQEKLYNSMSFAIGLAGHSTFKQKKGPKR